MDIDYLEPHQQQEFWQTAYRFGECWLWNGYLRQGLGYHEMWGPQKMVRYAAHRTAWILTHGPIAKGYVVWTVCGQRTCINPAHLACGPRGANVARGGCSATSKVGDQDAIAMRAARAQTPPVPFKELEARYGITRQEIYRIVKGQRHNLEKPALVPGSGVPRQISLKDLKVPGLG